MFLKNNWKSHREKRRYITFAYHRSWVQCSDMELVKRKLEEMGMKYVTAVVEEGGIMVDQLFFHDPDGYMIEICNCENLPVLPLSACPTRQSYTGKPLVSICLPSPSMTKQIIGFAQHKNSFKLMWNLQGMLCLNWMPWKLFAPTKWRAKWWRTWLQTWLTLLYDHTHEAMSLFWILVTLKLSTMYSLPFIEQCLLLVFLWWSNNNTW